MLRRWKKKELGPLYLASVGRERLSTPRRWKKREALYNQETAEERSILSIRRR